MFEKIRQSKLMFWSVELLIIATLIFVATKIDFMFAPIFTFVSTLFAPILIAGFLYYLVGPVVNFLENKLGMKRMLAIGLVFILLIGLLAVIIGLIIPELFEQIKSLVQNFPQFVESMEKWAMNATKHPIFKEVDMEQLLEKFDINVGGMLKKFVDNIYSSVGSLMGKVINVALLAVTVPFILFYMLKDGDRLIPSVKRFMPENYRDEITELLQKMSQTISKYIAGQAVECLFVAVATIIGYSLIGVDYAILFGTIAGITNMIPYLGPYLGLAPALVTTLLSGGDNPLLKAVLCCVVVLVVQQIDGNIIYPNIIGKSLSIHPLTIIIILLVAGNLAGLLGMILGVPAYAIAKTIVTYVYDIVQLKKREKPEI